MTIKECYDATGSDYNDVLNRLGSEALVKKFALKFLNDPSFNELTSQLEAHNVEGAFRASHTLKGVCLNLGFTGLHSISSELTEILRGGELPQDDKLYVQLKEQYTILVEALDSLE